MSSRTRAADDFTFIYDRMQKLRGAVELPPAESPGALTTEECIIVARHFGCQWVGAEKKGCGRNVTRDCLKHGRCVHA